MAQPRLVLASRSPQREVILSRLGLDFEVVPSGVDEFDAGEPSAVVIGNALRKARAVSDRLADPGALVVGGDTVIVHQGSVIGKPADPEEAAAFMRRLSGSEHEVLGGLAVVRFGGEEKTAVTATQVRFRSLSDSLIAAYVATGEWEHRSGAYAIQQGGSILVESITGDYLNIIGLSVNDLAHLAPELGIA
ncbi:MAG: septum formation protein Maf [Thermoleophilaceae bacterium]|nr:septum formation protein Maf [Thermoleophilaceae bacterium]